MDSISLQKQRQRRQETNNAATKKYERTKKGKLMRLYRNMRSRITGVQKQKHHLYKDKPLIEKEKFYEWAMSCPEFHRLYDDWVSSGYDRRLTPSVDRIDSSKGYEIENMEWVTHSENSRRGGMRNQIQHVA